MNQIFAVLLIASLVACSETNSRQGCPRGSDCDGIATEYKPDPELECSPGEVNMKLCDSQLCTELNATAGTRCTEDGHYAECSCIVSSDACAAADCAAGYQCFEGKCLETERCSERACEAGFACWDGSVCGQVIAAGQPAPVSLALTDDALY